MLVSLSFVDKLRTILHDYIDRVILYFTLFSLQQSRIDTQWRYLHRLNRRSIVRICFHERRRDSISARFLLLKQVKLCTDLRYRELLLGFLGGRLFLLVCHRLVIITIDFGEKLRVEVNEGDLHGLNVGRRCLAWCSYILHNWLWSLRLSWLSFDAEGC